MAREDRSSFTVGRNHDSREQIFTRRTAGSRSRRRRKEESVMRSLLGMVKVKHVWSTICTIGFTYQIFLITVDYSRYPVTSEITIELDRNPFIPAVSFCIKARDLVFSQEYPSNDSCIKSNFDGDDCDDYFWYGVSLKRMMDNYTWNLEKYVAYVKFASTENYEWEEYPYQEAKEFLHTFYKSGCRCLRINKNQTERLNYEVISGREFTHRHIFDTESYYVLKFTGYIFFHEHNSFPRGYELEYHAADLTGQYHDLSYTVVDTNYLPSPYFSKCENYTFHNLESREHCVDKCVQDLIDVNFGINYTEFQVTVTDFSRDITLLNESHLPEPNKTVHGYNDYCRSKCPLSCKSLAFSPVVSYNTNSGRNRSGWKKFTIKLSHQKPRFVIKFSPKLSLLELLIYVASSSSLWFGFVFYSSPHLFRDFFKCSCNKSQHSTRIHITHEPHYNFPLRR